MHDTSALQLQGLDRDALARVVEPIVRAHGAELVELQFKREHAGWVLRVTVEKAGACERSMSTRDAAVDLDLCADVARDLGPALDVADLIAHAYSLEVGSPGLERALRGERDFVRFAGEKAKVRVRDAVEGQRVLLGKIEGVRGGKLRIAVGAGRVVETPVANVESARLVFELIKQQKR